MAGATGSALVEGISPLGSVPVVAEAGAGLVAATIPAADGLPAHLEETLGTNKGAMEEPTAGSVEAVGKGRWRLFGKKKGEKKEKAPAQPMVKYWELYRYSDPVDWLLMTLGSVGAIANGVSLPGTALRWLPLAACRRRGLMMPIGCCAGTALCRGCFACKHSHCAV